MSSRSDGLVGVNFKIYFEKHGEQDNEVSKSKISGNTVNNCLLLLGSETRIRVIIFFTFIICLKIVLSSDVQIIFIAF